MSFYKGSPSRPPRVDRGQRSRLGRLTSLLMFDVAVLACGGKRDNITKMTEFRYTHFWKKVGRSPLASVFSILAIGAQFSRSHFSHVLVRHSPAAYLAVAEVVGCRHGERRPPAELWRDM